MCNQPTDVAFRYRFSSGQTAYILNASNSLGYAGSLAALGLIESAPSMVVIGGASKMSPESKLRAAQIFTEVLAPIAETYQITVFDGGTEAGVIDMMGKARNHIGGSFNLVGFAPKAKINLPGHSFNRENAIESKELTDLEQHHTHFALIPGITWGSESSWLANCASLLASHHPSITILINGGQVSLSDLRLNLSAGRHTIVIAGSGRLADEIANTISGTQPSDNPVIQNLAKAYYPSQLSIFELDTPLDILANQLTHHFSPRLIPD